MSAPPPAKKKRTDGNLDFVDKSVLLAAQDHQKWIEERRKNWPSKARIEQRQAEQKLNPPPPQQQQEQTKPAPVRTKNIICRYFLRGKCNAGAKCRFSHDKSAVQQQQQQRQQQQPKPDHVYKRYEAPVKSSLFVKLLQTDHDAEDERFLDFVVALKESGGLD